MGCCEVNQDVDFSLGSIANYSGFPCLYDAVAGEVKYIITRTFLLKRDTPSVSLIVSIV